MIVIIHSGNSPSSDNRNIVLEVNDTDAMMILNVHISGNVVGFTSERK